MQHGHCHLMVHRWLLGYQKAADGASVKMWSEEVLRWQMEHTPLCLLFLLQRSHYPTPALKHWEQAAKGAGAPLGGREFLATGWDPSATQQAGMTSEPKRHLASPVCSLALSIALPGGQPPGWEHFCAHSPRSEASQMSPQTRLRPSNECCSEAVKNLTSP